MISLNLFGNSFQPSEFVKYLIPLYVIHKITGLNKPIDFRFFAKVMIVICVPMALILVEPDNGTVLIIGVAIGALCLLARVSATSLEPRSEEGWLRWGGLGL